VYAAVPVFTYVRGARDAEHARKLALARRAWRHCHETELPMQAADVTEVVRLGPGED